MPRPSRVQYPGAYYHIFNRGVNKQAIVKDERDRRTFISLLGECVKKYRLSLFAYCLMTNHFHLFLRISEVNLSEAMWFLQLNFSRYMKERHDRVGHLFQGRYQHRHVNEEIYAFELLRYIHMNPVHAGIVKDPAEYLWSSYLAYTGKMPAWDWLNTVWMLEQFYAPDEAIAIECLKQYHRESPHKNVQKRLENMRSPLYPKPKKPKVPGTLGIV